MWTSDTAFVVNQLEQLNAADYHPASAYEAGSDYAAARHVWSFSSAARRPCNVLS